MKYKLIKTYPGSPELGTIVEKHDSSSNYYCGLVENIVKSFFIEKDVENQSEYWEKVVEKDYEILSINHIQEILKYESSMDLVNILWSIHSVRRLSDGEIFTINDEISPSWNDTTWNITKFYTKSKDGTLCVTFGKNVCRCSINDIKKPKQPLLKNKEKDYEILSFIVKSNNYIMKLSAGSFSNDGCTEEDLIKDEDCDIYSIKRLSDGEEFTIGDFVNDRTISSFSINWMEIGFKIHCDDVGKGNINDGCFFELKDLKKNKRPIFQTEDGVDIFEGDDYHNVNVIFNYKKIKDAKHNSVFFNKINDNKCFSTKEKAEEYILLNKPVLSLQDVHNISSIYYLNQNMIKPSTSLFKYKKNDLKQLVKQKLNK